MSDHRIILGDCLDPVTGLASLGDKSVDHVICDPPYEAEAHTLQRRVIRGGGGDGAFGVAMVEPLDFDPITAETRAGFGAECGRLARRWVLAFCQAEAISEWRVALLAGGLVWKRSGIWLKRDGLPQLTGDRPGMGYESIVIAHRPGRKAWNGGGKHGVWTCNKIGPDDRERTGHMTQKPLALMESLVRDFTDPGELVCDPFAGSGTTGVACKRLGRRFIGWERDPRYAEIAQKRIDAAHEQYVLGGPKPSKPKQALLGIE